MLAQHPYANGPVVFNSRHEGISDLSAFVELEETSEEAQKIIKATLNNLFTQNFI